MWYVLDDSPLFTRRWVTEERDPAPDIPAHAYQATFEPNKDWSQFYASSREIHGYWKSVVEKYGCMKYIKLNQKVQQAVWDEKSSKWQLQVGVRGMFLHAQNARADTREHHRSKMPSMVPCMRTAVTC